MPGVRVSIKERSRGKIQGKSVRVNSCLLLVIIHLNQFMVVVPIRYFADVYLAVRHPLVSVLMPCV